MYILARAWSDLGRSNANNSLAAATQIYSAGERLTAANFNLLHALVDESVASLRTTLRRSVLADGGATPANFAQPYLEAWISHSRGVYDICAEAQDELGSLAAACAADTGKVLDLALADAAQSSPPSTALALGFARSALNSAAMALDTAMATSRKLAAMTDAQMGTASIFAMRAGEAALSGMPAGPFRIA
ncbi:MAG: TIGR01841 family phasin [Rhodocyclaceae bacterium]|nr:TIGR01841 family phasin [Rhodocyclaceae bacterium]MBX3667484.1 TIGR01841 family phasin [Rhodocyclaceae bacterium]